MPRYPHITELPLKISRQNRTALTTQLAEQLRELILRGTLAPEDPLPSTRALAERLGISRGSVVAAYEQLAGEGYISATRGGTRVSSALAQHGLTSPAYQQGTGRHYTGIVAPHRLGIGQDTKLIDLTPGTPDTSLLATGSWRAAWRSAVAEPGITFPIPGSPNLQIQLARHLRLMRSVVREPQEILVTAGARDAFRLLLSALRQRENSRPLRIAVENPGYPSLHQIPAAFGHEIIPVEVDAQGLNPAALPRYNRPDLVLVAPSHQYPLGASMPVARRLELLHWAAEKQAFIVEDDYDSELRYVGDPLPALAALSRETGDRVITLGSFTKTLTPGLGLGYLLLPQDLVGPVGQLREVLGSPVSNIVQQAVANFLQDGGARRHIARMRRAYRCRRDLLLGEFAGGALPDWVKVLPMDGGLHAVLAFSGARASSVGEQAALAAATSAGVGVAALGDYWAHSGVLSNKRVYGLVIGFGGVPEHRLVRGLRILGQSLKQPLQ